MLSKDRLNEIVQHFDETGELPRLRWEEIEQILRELVTYRVKRDKRSKKRRLNIAKNLPNTYFYVRFPEIDEILLPYKDMHTAIYGATEFLGDNNHISKFLLCHRFKGKKRVIFVFREKSRQ